MATFSGIDLRCVRGERIVFDGLAFRLDDGAAIELRGANGSGKSSLLRMMAGLLPPASGTLLWNDESIARDRDAHRARINYIGHLDGVKTMLSVGENIRFWMTLRGDGPLDEDRYQHALETFGLRKLATTPARFLSAGQRRRTALARLVACPAPIWLLDEPATALDSDATAALDHAMAGHLGTGGMVVMSTHEALQRPVPRIDLDHFSLSIQIA